VAGRLLLPAAYGHFFAVGTPHRTLLPAMAHGKRAKQQHSWPKFWLHCSGADPRRSGYLELSAHVLNAVRVCGVEGCC
jgi:hypothetical protein